MLAARRECARRDFDVVMPDARGHGRSDGVASSFSPALLVEDAAALIEALGLGRAVVLGHSMGGATAARLAAAHPAAVAALILEDPPVARRESARSPADSPDYLAWLEGQIAWLARLRTLGHAERMTAALERFPPGALWPEEEYVPWVEACAWVDLDLMRLGPSLWAADADQSVGGLLPRLACPTLLLVATRPVWGGVPSPFSQETAASGPHLRVVRMAASHLMHRDAFEPYLSVVRAFLADHDISEAVLRAVAAEKEVSR